MTEQERIAALEAELRRLEEEEKTAALEEAEAEAEIAQLDQEIREAQQRGASSQEISELQKRRKQATVKRDNARSRKNRARAKKSAVQKTLEPLIKRALRPSAPIERPKPVVVPPPPPPAYRTEKEMPPGITLGQLGRTVATAGAGAVITAAFITSLKGSTKFVGAAIGATVGTIFLATSPVGSIPSDLGIGMLSGATGWLILRWTGKVKE